MYAKQTTTTNETNIRASQKNAVLLSKRVELQRDCKADGYALQKGLLSPQQVLG